MTVLQSEHVIWHFQILDCGALSADALAVATGNFSCGDCCSWYHLSAGIPPIKIRSPFIHIFCWYSTAPASEEGRQCDDTADVVLCLILCLLSSSGFGGELHYSLCRLLSLGSSAVHGGRLFLGLQRVSEVFGFQGLHAGVLHHGTGQQTQALAVFACKVPITLPVPPSPGPLGAGLLCGSRLFSPSHSKDPSEQG